MKKYLLWGSLAFLVLISVASAAPTYIFQRSILPEANSTYHLGTTTPSTVAWKSVVADDLVFFGEIKPDGSTCNAGEILQKSGTNAWVCATGSGSGLTSWSKATPTGTINGSNTVFSVPGNTVNLLYLNGVYMVQNTDYTLSGVNNTTLTYTEAPVTNSTHQFVYVSPAV